MLVLAGTAKSRFSAKAYNDHMALVRAYEGWKDAEREGSAYEYCWRNFFSAQTLQAIHSLRKQFSFIVKDAGLVEADAGISNKLSHNQSLVRAVICAGIFPGIASVVGDIHVIQNNGRWPGFIICRESLDSSSLFNCKSLFQFTLPSSSYQSFLLEFSQPTWMFEFLWQYALPAVLWSTWLELNACFFTVVSSFL
ncbi:hypothetical protein RIF29_29487 [Crotalaria pallida]|uniref:RNA helicase n=1 Tax=Crotalaria pallida TaxID=3830 RepID=A0AAN9EFK9_CROPI